MSFSVLVFLVVFGLVVVVLRGSFVFLVLFFVLWIVVFVYFFVWGGKIRDIVRVFLV